MKIKFISICEDATIEYTSNLEMKNNTLIFKDQSIENTTVLIEVINENELFLERFGDTNMIFHALLGELTSGEYANKMGLSFQFQIFTKEILFQKGKISFKYDYFIEKEFQNTYEICLLIK